MCNSFVHGAKLACWRIAPLGASSFSNPEPEIRMSLRAVARRSGFARLQLAARSAGRSLVRKPSLYHNVSVALGLDMRVQDA